MKIFMVGGTGLLGSVGAKELISRGHEVVTISLPPLPKDADIPKEMKIYFGNVIEMKDEEIKQIMEGCEGFVFAAGVDERIEFPPPVYDYFKKYNIDPVKRLLSLCKEMGIKKCVILGSYFSHFAKTMPKLDLYNKHPYIKSRIDQENVAFSFSDKKMEVMVLELPYIFGVQNGRKPVWQFFIDMFLPMKTIYYPKGGTTMVTLKQVGQALAGAVEKGKGGTAYPVGWYNKSWREMIAIINKNMGYPNKKIVTIPTFLYKLATYSMAKKYKKRNVEPGLNPVKFVKLMTSNAFIDKEIIEKELGVEPDDIDKAIGESITYCMKIHNEKKQVIGMKGE
ncbi:MAG: NAD-dependent epimerase/dehydratase family protein [Clostridia bacterium]|nr:NAD-dependent epimerase/dehydratase family protein [Clostridia bacterium]